MIAAEGPSSYRQLMALVLDESNWPILIHCNAGKDRTGIATALILEAVGVERDVIMDDYLLTNSVGRSADRAALLAFYARIDQRYGSMDAFLLDLGVDAEARRDLAAALTADPPNLAMRE